MSKVYPCDDGCWYCHRVDGERMIFSVEFDTNLHPYCLKRAIELDPHDREAQIILKELSPLFSDLQSENSVDKTVYWPYNTTFQRYHDVPLAGKRAKNFVEKRNQEKGGHWVLHSIEQYNAWFESQGKPMEFVTGKPYTKNRLNDD